MPEDLLPYPVSRAEVIEYYKNLYENHGNEAWKGVNFAFSFAFPTGDEEIGQDNQFNNAINFWLIERAKNQVNEACNKLWATVELYNHLGDDKSKWLCNTFDDRFSQTSTIPALYYSLIAGLLSILHFFGVGSIRKKMEGKSYNIIRTKDNIIMKTRGQHIQDLFGKGGGGWHAQVFQLYDGLLEKGIELPQINIEQCKKLKNLRFKYDYDVLSFTRMGELYGKNHYFDYCPLIIDTIEKSIELLHEIEDPLKNKADSRFTYLKDSVHLVYEKYRIPCPIREESSIWEF